MGALKHRCPRRLVLLALALCVVARAAEPLEYAVKAAYLSKFGFYVAWPDSAFASATAPLNLCVVGEDPFGNLIDEAVAGQQVAGRPVAVKRLKTVARESGCHIAYVGGEARTQAVTDGLRGSTALVVTDARSSGTAAGAVHFVIKDNRVRFTIDDDAAAQNGLEISSKLLSLAVSVKPRGGR